MYLTIIQELASSTGKQTYKLSKMAH